MAAPPAETAPMAVQSDVDEQIGEAFLQHALEEMVARSKEKTHAAESGAEEAKARVRAAAKKALRSEATAWQLAAMASTPRARAVNRQEPTSQQAPSKGQQKSIRPPHEARSMQAAVAASMHGNTTWSRASGAAKATEDGRDWAEGDGQPTRKNGRSHHANRKNEIGWWISCGHGT